MNIDQIRLTNFKNFGELNVSFSPGVNLFVGSNGTGKTSILEAINVAAGGFFGTQPQRMQRLLRLDEIRLQQGQRLARTTVEASSEILQMNWSRTINRDTKSNDSSGISSIASYGETFLNSFDIHNDNHIAPLISYYSTQRLFRDANVSARQRYDIANGRRNGYLNCLHEKAIKGILTDWLGNAATMRATYHIKEIDKPDLILTNVEQAIRKVLMLFLNLPEDFSLKIYQDVNLDNEVFIHYDNGDALPLNFYSDGFRNLIYLIMDLVWRASQLNPWLTLTEISENVTGVVTIDEIDLHLHPKWQAKVISAIQTLFPKVQFFITTHSPTVVANFENGSLYVIEDNQVTKHEQDYFGKQINAVLKYILGAADRHIPTQEKLDKLFRLIDDNQIEEYQPLLEELTTLLGEEDTDIKTARTLIEWQEFSKQEENAVH